MSVKLLTEVYRPQGAVDLITGPAGGLYDFVMADRAAVQIDAEAIRHLIDALTLVADNATDAADVRAIIAQEVRGFARKAR
jgi:hypothetical protein